MSKHKPPTGPTFLDDPHAPDFFSTGATGFFIIGGNIAITFEALRIDHSTSPGPINRVVVARIVLPISGAHGLAAGLYDFMDKNKLTPPKPETKDVQ